MRRFTTLAIAALLVLSPLVTTALPTGDDLGLARLEAMAIAPSAQRAYVDGSDWPMYQRDAGHTGTSTSPIPGDNGTIWDIDLDDTLIPAPIVTNNTVFLTSSTGTVSAMNASTGEEVWTATLGSAPRSTPAVAGGLLVIGTSGGGVLALDMSDGGEEWSVDVGGAVNSSPIIDGTEVFVGDGNGKVWALNLSDGKDLWNATVGGPVTTSPALSGGILMVTSGNAIDAFNSSTGSPAWTNTTAGTKVSTVMAKGSSAAPSSWMAFVTSDDDLLYAFAVSNGTLMWSSPLSAGHPLLPPARSQSMVVASGRSEVMAFNYSNGDWIWNYTTLANITTPPVLDGDTLLIGTAEGLEAAPYTTSASGARSWSFDMVSVLPPAIAYGRAFAATSSGIVVAFGHRPTAVIDAVGPDPVPQGDPLTMRGHGTDAGAFVDYRWSSDRDGQISQGSTKATTTVYSLSPGTHEITFWVQDDNWTWSEGVNATVKVEYPTEWPMFGQNSHRTSASKATVPATNGTKWVVDLTDADDRDIISSPIIVGDMAFVGTRDHFIHAVNLTNGEILWTFKTGGAVDSTPVYSNGYIYFGSDDSRVYCMDADPSDGNDEGVIDFGAAYDRIWSFDTNGNVWSSPAIVNGVLYVTTSPGFDQYNPNPARLYAISTAVATAQRELWHFSIPNNAQSFSSPLVLDDIVVFGANDNRIYAVDRETGEEAWNITTGDSVQSSPAYEDGMIYVGSNDNRLYAIHESNGSLAWSKPLPDAIQSSPAVADGVVYVGTMNDNRLYALDAVDGDQLWSFQTQGSIWSSPSVSQEHVVFGSFDGNLYVVNRTTHSLYWKKAIEPVAHSSPAIARDTVLIGGAKGYLYAFGKAPDLSVLSSDISLSLSTPQVGVQVTVTAMVGNLGTLRGNGSVVMYDDTEPIGTPAFVDIPPGGSTNVSVTWFPQSPGAHILRVNITNILPHDSNAVNNKAIKAVTVLEQTEGWRMFHRDERHSGLADVPTPNNNQVKWSYNYAGEILSSPVVADQLLFIGTSNGMHSLVENPSGQDTGVPWWGNTSMGGVDATAAIVNGIVYAPSQNGWLYAIDAWNGKTLWEVDISAGTSSPIVANGTVYIGNTEGEVLALNPTNGSEIWRRDIGGTVLSSPASHDDLVIAATADDGDSRVVGLRMDNGDEVWSFPVPYSLMSSPAIDENGYLFISDLNGTVYKLEAKPDFKDDGISNGGNYDLIWSYDTGQTIRTTAAVTGNNLVLAIGNATMMSMTSNGELNWRRAYAMDNGEPLLSSPAVAQNKIFVGGDKIYCLDISTGLEVWSYVTTTPVHSSPAVTVGKVFFASNDGYVYAFTNITPQKPTAVITNPLDGSTYRTGETILFDGSGSTDDGVILDYQWDFGDGTDGRGETVAHSYDTTGSYTITLTVKDNELPPLSNNVSATIYIIPNAAPSLSGGSVDIAEGDVGTLFNFTVTYSDPDNDPPWSVRVTVSGTDYPMEPVDPGDADYLGGVLYYCRTQLPSGNHTHTFRASDGVLENSTSPFTGPKVWQVATFVKDEITVEMEFVGEGEVVIEPPTFPPEPPAGLVKKDIIRLSTEDISEWKWMRLEVNGTGRNITEDVKADTLRIYWFDGTWKALNTTPDATKKIFTTNITYAEVPSLGLFGLFGEPEEKNQPPTITEITANPGGNVDVGTKVTLTVKATDNENDTLYYRIDWGDGHAEQTFSMDNKRTHKFNRTGTFTVRVYVTDSSDFTNETRIVTREHQIRVIEPGSNEALIVLAIIIIIVLAVALAVPTRPAEDDEEKEGEEEEDEEVEEEKDEEEEALINDDEE